METDTYTVAQLIKALQDLPQDLPVLDACREDIVAIYVVRDDPCPWLPNDYVML